MINTAVTNRSGAVVMNCSLRHNKHLNHNFRKLKNYMKVSERFLFQNVCQKRLGTQICDCKIGFLNVKIKRFPNVNKTFPQRLDKAIL